MSSVRDWQRAGVTLRVEVATSGSLIVGGNQTDFIYTSGGPNGAPKGWTAGEYPPPGNIAAYNFTTQTGIFSVSVKAQPTSNKSAGIWSPTFPLVPGHRYQLGATVRTMEGKHPSEKNFALQRSSDGGNTWTHVTGVSGMALVDWEDTLATSAQPIPAGATLGRIEMTGRSQTNNLGLWGVQWWKVFIRQLDLAPISLTWTDITCDVKALGVRYGRERFTNRYEVSSMTLELANDEGVYSFHDPHPLGLQPGRQVRVIATYNGVDYPFAFHVLDTITDGYSLDGRVVSQWTCTDPSAVLANVPTKTNAAPGVKGGGRINLILDQIGYQPRIIDPGVWFMQDVIGSGRTLRDEAGVTADSEGGNFFADRQGNCVYKDRNWPSTDTNLSEVTADLVGYPHEGWVPIVDGVPTKETAPVIDTRELVVDWSLARVVNYVELANAGQATQTFIDDASYKTYGPHTYQRLDFVLSSETYLADRANDIMTGYSEPVLRINAVAFAPGLAAGAPKTNPAPIYGWINAELGTAQAPDRPEFTMATPMRWTFHIRPEFDMALDAGDKVLVAHWSQDGSKRQWRIARLANKTLNLYLYTADGTNRDIALLTSAMMAEHCPKGKDVWLRVDLFPQGPTAGKCRASVYKSYDGNNWTLIRHQDSINSFTAGKDAPSAVFVGRSDAGTANPWIGRIYRVQYEKITAEGAPAGTIFTCDPYWYTGGTTFTDTSGNTWTLSSAKVIEGKEPAGFVPSKVWQWTLGAFLNHMVRVWYVHPANRWGYAVCTHIQSIEHRITPDDWETRLQLDLPDTFTELVLATRQPAPVPVFVLPANVPGSAATSPVGGR